MLKPIISRAAIAAVSMTAWLGSSAVSAEWLSLFSPKASGIQAGEAIQAAQGLEAFNALGCGECHRNLADGSYASGFRVVAVDAVSEVAEKLDLPHSPAEFADTSHSINLADREYVRSDKFDAIYIREVHSSVPGVAASLRRFDRASASEQQEAVEYMLMF